MENHGKNWKIYLKNRRKLIQKNIKSIKIHLNINLKTNEKSMKIENLEYL